MSETAITVFTHWLHVECQKHAMILTSGLVIVLTPPARAAVHSPDLKAMHAWYSATNDEEQAVSMAIEGPLNLNEYEIRPLRNARRVPALID